MRITSQRRAPRVSCRIPVRIFGRQSDLNGTIRDISRLGVRLSVHMATLERAHIENILRLGHLVEQHLGARFKADLHPDQLGSLVRKRLSVVRIGQDQEKDGVLEVGCEFGAPLSDDELRALALDLPAREVHAAAHAERRSHEFEAFLLASAGWGGHMLTGRARTLDAQRAEFCTDRGDNMMIGDRDVTTVAKALARSYGPWPVLEVVQGNHQLWAKKTRIRQVESPGDARGVRIELETFSKAR